MLQPNTIKFDWAEYPTLFVGSPNKKYAKTDGRTLISTQLNTHNSDSFFIWLIEAEWSFTTISDFVLLNAEQKNRSWFQIFIVKVRVNRFLALLLYIVKMSVLPWKNRSGWQAYRVRYITDPNGLCEETKKKWFGTMLGTTSSSLGLLQWIDVFSFHLAIPRIIPEL